VVSNVPFGSTSKLLYQLADAASTGAIRRLVLLLQSEVAERLCAGHGNPCEARGGGASYSTLTVEYALRSSREGSPPQIAAIVPREAFAPRPKVGTSVVVVEFDRAPAGEGSPGALERRRELLTAAFARRGQAISESWAPVLAYHPSAEGASPKEAESMKSLLAKQPWEVSPSEFEYLSVALAESYSAALEAGATLDTSRGAPRPPASIEGTKKNKKAKATHKKKKKREEGRGCSWGSAPRGIGERRSKTCAVIGDNCPIRGLLAAVLGYSYLSAPRPHLRP